MINRGVGSGESFTALPSAELRSTGWLPAAGALRGCPPAGTGTGTSPRAHGPCSEATARAQLPRTVDLGYSSNHLSQMKGFKIVQQLAVFPTTQILSGKRKAFLFHYMYPLNRCPNRPFWQSACLLSTRQLSPLWLRPKYAPFCHPGTRGAWDSLGPGSRSRARGAACSPPARQDHRPVSTCEPS